MRAEERGTRKGSWGFIPAGLVRNMGEKSEAEGHEAKALTQRYPRRGSQSRRWSDIKAPGMEKC